MKVLITGARAPIALDWAYRIKRHSKDNFVAVADSFVFPLGRFSKHADIYIKTASPRFYPKIFVSDLIKNINKYNINILIPTCEEVFYISRYIDLFPKNCFIFTENFNILSALHSKWKFLDFIREDANIKKPKTFYLESPEEFKEWYKNHRACDYIIKPVFSRFGSEVIFNIDSLNIPKRYPVIAQQKLRGKELCSYTICIAGKIIAHSCYYPKYKAGPGAGIYFEPFDSSAIFQFCRDLVEKINYTGQIAFDFFKQEDNTIYPIECNPRGTSGLHLIPTENDVIESLFIQDCSPSVIKPNKKSSSSQVAFAMILFSLSNMKHRKLTWIKDFLGTPDVYKTLQTKRLNFFQIISFVEIVLRSIKYRLELKKASTQDIEWDGDEII